MENIISLFIGNMQWLFDKEFLELIGAIVVVTILSVIINKSKEVGSN